MQFQDGTDLRRKDEQSDNQQVAEHSRVIHGMLDRQCTAISQGTLYAIDDSQSTEARAPGAAHLPSDRLQVGYHDTSD